MARLAIIAVGRMKANAAGNLAEEYWARAKPLLGRLGYSSLHIRELPESRAANAAQRKREEAQAIFKAAGNDALLVALDERGENLSSRQFTKQLRRLAAMARRDVVIVIGGPDGLDEEVRQHARLVLCFGRMTWPHQLVRVMLAEQLYRAAAIAANLPYHRD